MPAGANRPLSGITVLDFGQVYDFGEAHALVAGEQVGPLYDRIITGERGLKDARVRHIPDRDQQNVRLAGRCLTKPDIAAAIAKRPVSAELTI
jgi:hypothetical protein